MSTPAPTPDRPGTRALRGLAVLGSVAAALLVWLVGDPVLGAEMVFTQGDQDPQDVGAAAIVLFSAAAALLGWALLAVLERFASARARTVWTAVAVVVLALSCVPLLDVEATGGTKAVLALTHFAVAAVLIPLLRRASPRVAAPAAPVTAGPAA
ncbi:DUF6069 family protein [Streptomyces avicenniae]|uniref:DUF6069 family protein n=1 Tax=Streptomyces avicenniae TaxID=500153 RepID=UPI00069C668B|nr:DUF6069 family protein [Streptomyces avicenniae]